MTAGASRDLLTRWLVAAALLLPLQPALAQVPAAAPNLDLWRPGLVTSMAIQGDGKMVVSGTFRRINGDSSRRSLARLNADGSLDPTFTLDADGDVSLLKRHGGFIYAVGGFTTLGGVARAGLARIVEATGALDMAWNPNAAPGGGVLAIDFDAGGNAYVIGLTGFPLAKLDPSGARVASWAPTVDVNAALAVSGNNVYVFGQRSPRVGPTQNSRIYKIDATTGVVDGAWSENLAAIDFVPQGIAADGAGSLYAWGLQSGIVVAFSPPQTGLSAPSSLVKLNESDGQVAAGWTHVNPGFDLDVSVGPAGLFATRATSGSRADGASARLVRLSPTTGAPMGTFSPATWAGANVFPTSIEQSAGHVFWTGDFGYVNGQRKGSIAKLDATTGSVVPALDAKIQLPGYVAELAQGSGGKVYVGGAFTEIAGQPIDNVLRLNGDGTHDATWTRGAPGLVYKLLEAGGYLYIAGSFEHVDASNRRFLARFSLATQAHDSAWNPAPNGIVRGLATDGASIYVAGGFDQLGGQSRTCLGRVDSTVGALDAGWAPPITILAGSLAPGVTGASACVPGVVIANGFAYLGLSAGRLTVNASQRAFGRVNLTSGASDPAFDPLPTGTASTLSYDGSSIYVARGTNTSVFGGVTTRIAKLNPATGVTDPGFIVSLPAGLNGPVALTATPGGVFASTTIGSGVPTGFFSSWNTTTITRHDVTTGARDTAWNVQSPPYLYSFGSALAALSGTRVLAGGGFEQVAGESRVGVAAFSTGAPAAPTAVATAKSHTLALDTTGKVFAWGSDSHGQLGQGRAVTRPTPAQVANVPAMSQISVAQHVLTLDIYSQVWAWGENSCGQLGPRAEANATKPARVVGAVNMIRIAAGGCFSLALKSDGTVWGWGLVPGYGTGRELRQLAGLAGITAIAAGSSHALLLRNDGRVLALGDNAQGQLGTGATGGAQAAVLLTAPTAVTAIAAGDVSSMAIAGGQPYFWGRHADATLVTSPVAAAGLGGNAAAISVTGNRPYAARADGAVLAYNAASPGWVVDFATFAGIAKVAAGNKGYALGIDGAGQLYGGGINTSGQLGQGNTNVFGAVVAVPGMANTAMVAAGTFFPSVLALKNDGSLWFWGADTAGESGDGGEVGSSVPVQASIPATVKAIAAGQRVSAALDTSGQVWAWGLNDKGALDPNLVNRSTPAHIAGASSIRDVAAGDGFVLLLTANGSVQRIGTLATLAGTALTTITEMNGSTRIAAGDDAAYALRADGVLYAIGANASGQLGNNSTSAATTAVQVLGIGGTVARIAAAKGRAGVVTTDGRVWTWGGAPLGNGSASGSLTAVQVPGINDAVDISVGSTGTIVRRANGSLVAWGDLGLSDATGQNLLLPYPVAFYQAPQSAWAGRGSRLGFIVGSTGLAWGFGRYHSISTLEAALGDGTFVPRPRPVVVMAGGGTGNVDTGDWHFDLDPTTPESVPAASTPKMLGIAGISGSDGGLAVEATIKYKSADFGKSVNNYVFGLVPPTFCDQVKSAPGLSSKARLDLKAAKADGFVLAQLTPAGWTDVQGQLIAYSQGTANAAGGATNILNGVPATSIAGARFCIGYGESSGSMLSFNALREVLLLPGAASNASGVPCILTGVYVDGPAGSRLGSAVTFNASVVGLSPTGQVQFRDGAQALAAPLSIAAANDAVATAQVGTSALAVGEHSIGATYFGDSQNASTSAEIPLRHVVTAAATQANLVGPASSDQYSQVTFQVTVIGLNPTGSVQFKDGVADVGASVPLVGGQATLRTDALALGDHSITAVYSGDGNNVSTTSNAVAHKVVSVFTTRVTLTSSAIDSVQGASVTLTATVTGMSPTGSVTFLDGATVLGTASLVNGVATLTLSTLGSGAHSITASYSGDSDDQAVTSSTIIQQVAVPAVFSMNPATLAFGGQLRNTTSAPRAVVITNTGGASLTVGSVGVVGAFTQTNNCATVAGGASCTIQVRFAPTALGAVNGSVTIQTSLGPNVVALTGTGATSLVSHYYTSILRRAPDAGGQAFWDAEAVRVSALGVNVNEVWFAMAQAFYFSAEYAALNRDNTGFITDLYTTFFQRAPDQAGLDFWVGQLNGGMPREVALASFMFSTEFRSFTSNIYGNTAARAEVDAVTDFYRGLLARLPDDSGFNFWVGRFRAAQCAGQAQILAEVEAISSAYALSQEYTNRARTNVQYVGDLYNAFLRRGGDLAGVLFWINQVASGAQTREQVRVQFRNSAEFQARVAAIVAQGCLP